MLKSHFKIFERAKRILEMDFRLFTLMLFIVVLLKSGIWVIPNIDASRTIANNLFNSPIIKTDDSYLSESWLSPYLAHLFGLTSFHLFRFFHFTSGLFALILMHFWTKRNFPYKHYKSSFTYLILLPVSAEIFYWTGMDSFTFLLLVLCVVSYKSKTGLFLISAALGMQHFEIGLTNFLGLFAWEILNEPKKILKKPTIFMFLGLIFGRLFLEYLFRSKGLFPTTSRFDVGMSNLSNNLSLKIRLLPITLWSMYGVVWFLIIRSRKSPDIYKFLFASIIPIFISLFAADQSRIIQLGSFLLVVQAIIVNRKVLEHLQIQDTLGDLVVWFVIPWIWVYTSVRSSVLPNDYLYIISRIFHNDMAPWDGTLNNWPFR